MSAYRKMLERSKQTRGPWRRAVSALKRLAVGAASVVAITGAAAGASQARAQAAGQWQSPAQVYQKVCAYCHETGVGPHIRGLFPAKFYAQVVRHGMAAMPAFRPTDIDDATLQKLGEWLATPPARAANDRGKQ